MERPSLSITLRVGSGQQKPFHWARKQPGVSNGYGNHTYNAIRVRSQRNAAQGGNCINDRHRNRVVRFLPLWNGCRAYLWEVVLSWFGSTNGNVVGLRHLFYRFRRPSNRRGNFRPLWGSDRSQSDAHRYAVVYGHCDLPYCFRADLFVDWHLGCDHSDSIADNSGHWRWR